MNIFFRVLLLPFIILFFFSCQNDDDDSPKTINPSKDRLVAYELITEVDKAAVKELASNPIFITSNLPEVFSDIFVYKILYNTKTVTDDPIVASGLVAVPKENNTAPMIVYEHGTLVDLKLAPSNFEGIESRVFA